MEALDRAQEALEGLSVGDAFGEQFLHGGPAMRAIAIPNRAAPVGRRWIWTDDTAMALSIVETLALFGRIEPRVLAEAFARRYVADPGRGYGGGSHQVLSEIAQGTPYDSAARAVFHGEGSCGNGGAMRAAPIGAFFAGDLAITASEAAVSASPTHAHPDGVAGAVAIAVAACAVFAGERDPARLIATVVELTPGGPTRDGLVRARGLLGAAPADVVPQLGNGSRVLAADTVPFAVWCAATHLGDYATALWTCVDAGGDIDTTCAMVGGTVVGATGVAGIPVDWRASREPLA